MKNIIAILFLFSSVNMLSAQEKYTLSGYLRDGETGEELLYATVSVPSESQGVTTNLYGFYSLTLPAGTYEVDYSYVGFETTRMTITLDKDIQQNVELSTGSLELEEIVVTAEKKDANVTSTEMSTVALDMKETKLIPVLMGEQDVLKTIQLMPGVSSNSEGNSGFFVRGGNADQNLILLDEAPVYNASHLLGFFSVFNSDVLKDVKMYKGGISAEYGGRASSVMDVRMKNGNSKKWNASGGIGLISSRLTVEGPIVKDKGSVMVSGRRTYADVIARPFLDDASDLSLYFYDLNLKANYQISEKDRLYVSGYLGRDVFGTENFGFDWGNTTATLRWNHIFTNKLFSNTTFIYSDYDYGFNLDFSGQKITLSAGIFDYNFKQDFNYYLNPNNTLKFGGQAILHQFKPSQLTFENSTDNEDIAEQRALEGGIYITNDQKVNDRLSLNYGLRLSSFSNIGEYVVKEYNEDNEIISSTTYDKGEFYNTYIGLEPRVNATYLLTENSSVKASYNRNYQYLHLLSNSTSGTPTDIWTPSTPLIKPQIADQVALGWFKNFKDNKYEFSVEAYYKNLQNQIDYENGADIISNADVEAELVFGKGRAYGMEVYLKKKTGRLTGWLSYTLAKSERQFDPVNNGEWYSARQDRTHDISLVGIYEVSPRFNISASWVYYTGDAVTFPSGKYYVDGALVNLYTERNADRMPEYHRLDLGGTFILKDSKRFYSDLNVSFYNLYNRKNAYTITFQDSETVANASEAVRLSLFGIVPALTWNFKF